MLADAAEARVAHIRNLAVSRMYLLKTMVLELRVIHVLRNSQQLQYLVNLAGVRNVYSGMKGGRLRRRLLRLWVHGGEHWRRWVAGSIHRGPHLLVGRHGVGGAWRGPRRDSGMSSRSDVAARVKERKSLDWGLSSADWRAASCWS